MIKKLLTACQGILYYKKCWELPHQPFFLPHQPSGNCKCSTNALFFMLNSIDILYSDGSESGPWSAPCDRTTVPC